MSLNLYFVGTNSSVLPSAELLTTSVGTPTTFAGASTINNSTGWYEFGLGGPSTTFNNTGPNAPSGLGCLFDGTILQNSMIIAGSYSASLQFQLNQAATSVTGPMLLRFYKYNSVNLTYTAIGTISSGSSITINSTSPQTVTWPATTFSSVNFAVNEYLYVDCWFFVTANTMTAGGTIALNIPNSTTQGISTEFFTIPGILPLSTSLELDTFVRSNQSGWGAATDFIDSWTARDATATYSIVSNQGKILQNSTSVDEVNTLYSPASNTAYEIYGQCTTSNATSHPGIVVNWQSTGNMIKCEISPTAVNLVRYISGSQTTLKSDTTTKVTASNATYNFRFRWEVGGVYYFKVWIGTVAEPAAWNCNAISDTTYTNGAVGIYLAPRGATTDTCLWNQFYVSRSELYEDTTVDSLSSVDNSTSTVIPLSTDAISSPVETAAYIVNPSPTESLTDVEAVTFALSETIPTDAMSTPVDASTTTLIQTQSDALAGSSALDNFARANQSGFGTASDGINSWTTQVGNSIYTVSSDSGVIQNNEINTDEVATFYTPTSKTTFEIYAEAKSSNATNHIGLTAQYQSSGNMIKAEITTTATQIVRYINDTQVTLGSDATMKITTSNVTYAMRFRWTPDGLYYFKVWLKSNAEPTSWNVNGVSDTTYNSGSVGTYVAARTSTANTTTYAQISVVVGFAETVSYVVSPIPVEVLTDVEIQLLALSDTFAADSLTPLDSTAPTNNPTLSDVLSESELSAYALAETMSADSVTEQEVVVYNPSQLQTDATSNTESSAYALTQFDNATTLNITEINAVADYYSAEEDLVTSDSQLEAIVEAPTSDNVISNEVTSIIISEKFPSDSATNTEVDLTIVTQTDVTVVGTPDDSIIHGQPGIIFPDQLTITDSISFAIQRPLVDIGLVPSDRLDWDTNFTDHCNITESIVYSLASTLLDARSVLYANTIIDNPSAYYQLNEDTFGGIFQRDGSDQPNNASLPTLYGATLQYTWAQIEPDELDYFFSTIDQDILPWQTQKKKVILRVYVSSLPFNDSARNNNTAGQSTPQWVFDSGAAHVTGFDGAVYPVYWDTTFLAKYTTFVQAFADYYDTNPTVAAIIVSCGVNGTTSLESSGDTQGNTLALWNAVGYTPTQWMATIKQTIQIYQAAFQHTPLILSVNNAVIVPDNVYNLDQCISIAVEQGVWLMDENVFINEQHTNPNWHIVPLVSVPRVSIASGNTPDTLDGELTLMVNYQSDFAAVWAADITADNNETLIKYLDIAETKGLNDSSTNNYKMAIFGGVYPTSHISTGDYLNGAQQFDGLTGYGYIGKLAQSNTDAWTMKCTVYPTILPSEESIAFSLGNDGYIGFGGYAVGISGGATGGVGAKFCAHLPGLGWFDSGYSFPQVGQWYTLFVSYDGTTLRFYANGVETPNTYNVTAIAPSLAMTIGAQWDGMTRTAKRFFIGGVDECAVYPFALAANRIFTLSQIEFGQDELLSGTDGSINAIDQSAILDISITTVTFTTQAETLTLSENFTYSTASNNVAAYEVLAQDQFNRLVLNGLGTATDGNTWIVGSGTSALSVDNVGSATGSTDINVLFLGDTDETMQDVSCMFKVSDTSSTFGIVAFGANASNYYSLRIASTLQLYKTVSGSSSTLGGGAAFTLSAGVWYHLHLKVSEGQLYGSVWLDGSAEPAWMITASDTAFSSGSSGLYILGGSSGTVFNFNNFFSIDDILSDFVLINESYIFTSILPPLVDNIPTIIDVSTNTPLLNWLDPTLNETESFAPNSGATGTDFLLFGTSVQAWQIAYNPTEQITEQEILTTPVNIVFPAETAPPLSDAIVPYVTPVPVDQIEPIETIAETYSANLVDQLTVVDVSTVTQLRTIVDTDPSRRFIARAFSAPILIKKNTTLIASDKIVPNDRPLETSVLTTSDSIIHGPAFLLSDILTVNEFVLFAINETIAADVNSASIDSLVPTIIPSPIDALTEQETVLIAKGSVLPVDAVTVAEIVATTESSIFSPDTVASDDSATQENVAFLPQDFATIPDDATFENATFATVEGVANFENATFENATFATDFATPEDATFQNATFATVEGVANFENATFSENATLLPDAVIAIELLLATVAKTFVSDSVVASDTLQFATDTFEETDFATVEVVTSSVQDFATDVLNVAEITLSADTQTALDNTSTLTEQDNFIVFGNEQDVILLSGEFIFTIEAVAGTDLTSESETFIQIETYIFSLSDIALIPPSELGTFTVIPVPLDTLNSDETIAESLSLAFNADNASTTELLLSTIATSFTGWLDLLSLTEQSAYTTTGVPIEVANETESFVFASSNLYQDSSTTNTESSTINVALQEAEQSSILESSISTVANFATEQSSILESSTTTTMLLGDIPLLLSENATFAEGVAELENVAILDATQFATQSSNIDFATPSESSTIIEIATPIDATILEDATFFTVANATLSDFATPSENATFATIMAPIDFATILDFATLSFTVATIDTSEISDVSMVATVKINTDGLQASENVLYSTIMAPVEHQTLQEILTATLIHAETDNVILQELLSDIGYGLLDSSLNIVEVSDISSASYIKTFGIVRTGRVDGIIRTGSSTGTVRTGLMDGVIP